MVTGMYIITGLAVLVGVAALVFSWRLVNFLGKEKPVYKQEDKP